MNKKFTTFNLYQSKQVNCCANFSSNDVNLQHKACEYTTLTTFNMQKPYIKPTYSHTT